MLQAGIRHEYVSMEYYQNVCFILLVSKIDVMVNRDSWGHLYLIVRGEILGFIKDRLMRKLLPKMFSLIKNES